MDENKGVGRHQGQLGAKDFSLVAKGQQSWADDPAEQDQQQRARQAKSPAPADTICEWHDAILSNVLSNARIRNSQ